MEQKILITAISKTATGGSCIHYLTESSFENTEGFIGSKNGVYKQYSDDLKFLDDHFVSCIGKVVTARFEPGFNKFGSPVRLLVSILEN